MHRHSIALLCVIFGILAANVSCQIDVNPLMINLGSDAYGRPNVGLGTKWNFFGSGFSSGSNFGSGGYSNGNLIQGGPFSLGSFWGLGRRRR